MSQQQDKPRRTLMGVTFMQRIAKSGTEDDLTFASAKDAEIKAFTHDVLGPGLMIRWKDNPQRPQFIPLHNVRRIDYVEPDPQ